MPEKPSPGVIGIDEISIRKGHIYRIVVSDLEKKRAIWFGGKDRSEESMNLFYDEMGLQKPGKYGLRLWTCGRLLKTPPASTHRRLLSFTISFMS